VIRFEQHARLKGRCPDDVHALAHRGFWRQSLRHLLAQYAVGSLPRLGERVHQQAVLECEQIVRTTRGARASGLFQGVSDADDLSRAGSSERVRRGTRPGGDRARGGVVDKEQEVARVEVGGARCAGAHGAHALAEAPAQVGVQVRGVSYVARADADHSRL